MIFSCTRKVINQLKKYKEIEEVKVELDLYNWYVDLINIERKNYFLFTNSTTLFTFFVYAGTKKEKMDIEKIFEDNLKQEIIQQVDPSDRYWTKALSKTETYRFVKTNSRSVLGSMNDLKHQIKVQVWHKDGLAKNYEFIKHSLNKTPMSALKYNHPRTEMKAALEKA